MTRQEKVDVLLTVARAYVRRGKAIQYDQYSMDRMLRVTPRHQRFATPEEGTAQHTMYEDCACYVNAVYYNTFGYEMEADVTWNIVKTVKPLVYEYAPTAHETAEEQKAVCEELRRILQPGDALVFLLRNGNGHIILIGEEGSFYHCTSAISGNSYHYPERHSRPTVCGDTGRDSIERLMDPSDKIYLLAERIKYFCVIRPMERMGEPTADAMARMTTAKGLFCQVLSSHPGGKSVRVGDTATYTVEITNDNNTAVTADVSFTPTAGTTLTVPGAKCVPIAAGETVQLDFPLTVAENAPGMVPAPAVIVNGLHVWAQRLLVHAADNVAPEPQNDLTLLTALYAHYDALETELDVLWRKPQNPRKDGTVYGFFGGTGVLTPELMTDENIRTRCLRFCDLMAGDEILISDDALFFETYRCRVTENSLVGQFDYMAPETTLTGEEMDKFIDTLPGRFCYTVLRPGMKGRY